MKKRFVGHRFLKQAKNRVSGCFLKQCCRTIISSPLSLSQKKREVNPSREQKNAVMFANRISRRKITIRFTHRSHRREHNKSTSRKKMLFRML